MKKNNSKKAVLKTDGPKNMRTETETCTESYKDRVAAF